MGENSFAHRKYMYFHDQKYPHEAIDIHHIEVQSNGAKRVFLSLLAAIVVGNALYLVLIKEKSVTLLFSSFLLGISEKIVAWETCQERICGDYANSWDTA